MKSTLDNVPQLGQWVRRCQLGRLSTRSTAGRFPRKSDIGFSPFFPEIQGYGYPESNR